MIPDPATNNVAPFTKDQVALVYGSLWKQRYFTKVGDDDFPLGAQWEVKNKEWSKYHLADNADWWVPFYGADNSARLTGALCDGCHSVGYDIRTEHVCPFAYVQIHRAGFHRQVPDSQSVQFVPRRQVVRVGSGDHTPLE